MNMKKLWCSTVLVGIMAAPSVFAATITTIGGYGPWQTGAGGEFTFNVDAGLAATVNAYGAGAHDVIGPVPSFQTFCVEAREFVYANSPYSVSFSGASIYTSVSLTKGAAYLYSLFAQGALAYDYNNTGVGRHNDAADLQYAIWAFMGNQEGAALTLANKYELLAANALGGLANADSLAAAGEDGVYVVNMWADGHLNDPNYARQDMLIYSPNGPTPPVPDGGMTLALLGMGLSGLGFISRRFRAA
jgi:hypothetical protein